MEIGVLSARIDRYAQILQFPQEASEELQAVLQKIAANGASFSRFCEILSTYERDCFCHFTPLKDEMERISEELDVHPFTGRLLMYLCMLDDMRAHYAARGIDARIYDNTIRDLSYKLGECRRAHGVSGLASPLWFSGFLKFKRFALGRLQFELTNLKKPYPYRGILLPEGTLAIDVHIPRTGTPLLHAEVLDAYKEAREFFRDSFADKPVVFTCFSWMLDPFNLTVLAASSNMAAFARDFEIVEVEVCPDYRQLTFVFERVYNGDLAALPQDTSLRRAYVARIARGEMPCVGRGVFVME